MIVRRIDKRGFFLVTEDGKYVKYIDYTTHTGNHKIVEYLDKSDYATIFYNHSLLEVSYQFRKELTELNRVDVVVTTIVERI